MQVGVIFYSGDILLGDSGLGFDSWRKGVVEVEFWLNAQGYFVIGCLGGLEY